MIVRARRVPHPPAHAAPAAGRPAPARGVCARAMAEGQTPPPRPALRETAARRGAHSPSAAQASPWSNQGRRITSSSEEPSGRVASSVLTCSRATAGCPRANANSPRTLQSIRWFIDAADGSGQSRSKGGRRRINSPCCTQREASIALTICTQLRSGGRALNPKPSANAASPAETRGCRGESPSTT